jgi:hypothetical protein
MVKIKFKSAGIGSANFVELRVDDLVKDRLIWQGEVRKQIGTLSGLPNVIHAIRPRFSRR